MAFAASGLAAGATREVEFAGVSEDAHDCFSTWAYKSTTAFHGMHDELVLPWWFGALCFNYSLAGFTMILVKPKWAEASRFPYVIFAYVLIFFQGPLSFMADYMNMTHDSIYHTIDRFLAFFLLILEVCKIVTMAPHCRRNTFMLYASACAVAVASFFKSQEAQSNEDTDGFVFWHNIWHLYPLFCSVLMSYDYYVLGEYDAMASSPGCAAQRAKKPKLLSTVIMEHPKQSSSPWKHTKLR